VRQFIRDNWRWVLSGFLLGMALQWMVGCGGDTTEPGPRFIAEFQALPLFECTRTAVSSTDCVRRMEWGDTLSNENLYVSDLHFTGAYFMAAALSWVEEGHPFCFEGMCLVGGQFPERGSYDPSSDQVEVLVFGFPIPTDYDILFVLQDDGYVIQADTSFTFTVVGPPPPRPNEQEGLAGLRKWQVPFMKQLQGTVLDD